MTIDLGAVFVLTNEIVGNKLTRTELDTRSETDGFW